MRGPSSYMAIFLSATRQFLLAANGWCPSLRTTMPATVLSWV